MAQRLEGKGIRLLVTDETDPDRSVEQYLRLGHAALSEYLFSRR
ncbi:hypothetical protein ACQUQP_12205 [Marinobacterium sp. YM272]